MHTTLAFAGLVAAAAATATVWETADVTVTYCAPSVTDCPAAGANWEDSNVDPSGTWSAIPADPKETWSTWAEVSADPKSSWSAWETVADPKSTWAAIPDPKSTWSEWETVADPKSTWSAIPADPKETWSTWAEVSADPTSTWGTWETVAATTTETTWATWDSIAATSTATCPMYTATAPPAWLSDLPSSVASSLAAKWTGTPPSDWCYYSYSSVVATSTATTTWASWESASVAAASTTTTSSAHWATWTGAANTNNRNLAVAGLVGLAAVIIA